MFNELYEQLFGLDESEKTIRTIYKIYKDQERRLDPEIGDLDIALEGLEGYYRDYLKHWKLGYEKSTPKNLKKAYQDIC